jgi:hypothetical protein
MIPEAQTKNAESIDRFARRNLQQRETPTFSREKSAADNTPSTSNQDLDYPTTKLSD